MSHCTAIVLASGAGKRMQSDVAKQYMLLKGKPVLWYALNAFEKCEFIDEVILTVGEGEINYCLDTIVNKYGFLKVSAVIEGGKERYLSVWKALEHVKKYLPIEEASYVFIHDGARPFVNEQILQNTYEAVKEYDACVAGMPVKDTIKIADEDGFAKQTPNRRNVWAVQTPQVFERKLIISAYEKLIEQLEELKRAGMEITDDAMVVETMTSQKVKLVEASYENMKITTPEDMKIAESLEEAVWRI